MYHFVSGFINVTDLSVDVAWQVPRYAVSQLPVCISSYSCLYFDNWLTFNFDTSKNMIIILEFPNGKNVNREVQKNVTDHTCK